MYDPVMFVAELTAGLVFFVSLAYLSYGLGARWFSAAPVGVRLSAVCVIFSWLLSAIFAILMSVGMFKSVPAVLVALLCVALARVGLLRQTRCANYLAWDLSRLRHAIANNDRNVTCWAVLASFLLLLAVHAVRVLFLPVLGWDSLTYHSLKAGLWIQEGGWPTLNSPGGWEYYRSYFGGGEVFTAWAMLFLRSDLLAGVPDVCFWLLLGLTTACLATHCGTPRRSAVLIGAAFLCAPQISWMVGSGYVDTCANAFLLSAFLFLLRFARFRQPVDLCFTAASFGLASSVKVNMLATTTLMAPAMIVLLLVHRRQSIRTLLLCSLLYASPVVPWVFQNYVSTGYPLGGVPLSIGPIHLGKPPPNLVWFLSRPDLIPYKFASEAPALFKALAYYDLSLLLAAIGIPGLLSGVWRRSSSHVLAVILMIVSAVLYFSPSFSVFRLGWTWTQGRFLFPIIVLPAVVGLFGLYRLRRIQVLVERIATVCVITGVCHSLGTYILLGGRAEIVFLGVAVSLVVLFYYLTQKQPAEWSVRPHVAVPLIFIVFVIGMAACIQFKDHFRTRAYSECTTWHNFPRYWVPALDALKSESQPIRIAFAYGPMQVSQSAFLAPFLGAHMENSLVYLSSEEDGSIVPHHPAYIQKSNPSFAHWIDALQSEAVTHVLCLRPPCTELAWVENHPDLFTRLAGKPKVWGLFRVEWSRVKYVRS